MKLDVNYAKYLYWYTKSLWIMRSDLITEEHQAEAMTCSKRTNQNVFYYHTVKEYVTITPAQTLARNLASSLLRK